MIAGGCDIQPPVSAEIVDSRQAELPAPAIGVPVTALVYGIPRQYNQVLKASAYHVIASRTPVGLVRSQGNPDLVAGRECPLRRIGPEDLRLVGSWGAFSGSLPVPRHQTSPWMNAKVGSASAAPMA